MHRPSTLSEADVVTRLRAIGCVFAEDEARLLVAGATSDVELTRMIERRAAGEPLEHLLGWVEFCGLRIGLDAGVFIPRQRSEFLVRQAAELAGPHAVVLDLCCGSGAIGLAVTSLVGRRELHATDIDAAAVRCARRNLDSVGGQVYEGDLFAALPHELRGRVDVLVANVPYVPTAALIGMPVEAREHESRRTHDGGSDGLDVLRRVLAEVSAWLAPGGHLIVEVYRLQIEQARTEFERAGLDVRIESSGEYFCTVAIGGPPVR